MDARKLLKQWDIRPSKGLGQNFLSDQRILEKIVAAAELTPDEVALEIGAGVGTLTEQLAQEAGHVIAVELDERLMPVLRSTLSEFDNVTLIQGDILTLHPAALIGADETQPPTSNPQYKVVANLPYYITSVVLRHLLEASRKPRRMVITMQREVAERITAGPGQMSLLAVSVQFYGRPQLLLRIKPGSFYPIPQVDSAVVRVDLHPPPLPPEETADFFRVVRSGFSQRRKQLHNSLSAGLRLPSAEISTQLEEAGVDHRKRAQALTIEEWVKITRALKDSLAGESSKTKEGDEK